MKYRGLFICAISKKNSIELWEHDYNTIADFGAMNRNIFFKQKMRLFVWNIGGRIVFKLDNYINYHTRAIHTSLLYRKTDTQRRTIWNARTRSTRFFNCFMATYLPNIRHSSYTVADSICHASSTILVTGLALAAKISISSFTWGQNYDNRYQRKIATSICYN